MGVCVCVPWHLYNDGVQQAGSNGFMKWLLPEFQVITETFSISTCKPIECGMCV